MTAYTTMYMNMLTPSQPPAMLGAECTTPEIISNILMETENYNYAQQQQPQFPNCYLPEHMEGPVSYIPSPAAPCTGPEASLPVYCGPQVASSPPMPTSSLSPAGTTNEPQHYYHQFVKTELKFHICQRRQAQGSPTLPPETATYSTGSHDEVGWASPANLNTNTTTNNNNIITNTTNNNNNNNNNNCTAIENSFNYKSCLQSLSSPDDRYYYSSGNTLTPDDEYRRKKRRERNKIAATKCRNRKKEKTAILVKESEQLHHENVSLKDEITKLQNEIRKLNHFLGHHCCKMPNQHINNNNNNSNNNHNSNPLYNFDLYTAGSAL